MGRGMTPRFLARVAVEKPQLVFVATGQDVEPIGSRLKAEANNS